VGNPAEPQTGERSLDLLQWGLIPYWCKEKPKRRKRGLAALLRRAIHQLREAQTAVAFERERMPHEHALGRPLL